MNEKIKEIALKKFGYCGDTNSNEFYNLVSFAELIVKECSNICETPCLPIDVNLWRDMTKTAMSAYTARALAEEIKKRLLKDFPNDIFEDKNNEIHIICDETNNTQEDVDNNRLNVSIYIK